MTKLVVHLPELLDLDCNMLLPGSSYVNFILFCVVSEYNFSWEACII